LTRHFERRNRWYENLLKRKQPGDPRPVALLYRLLKAAGKNDLQTNANQLKVLLTEHKGILHLKLRGLADKLQLAEVKIILRGLSKEHYSQVVVNIEGLRFASDQAAAVFSKSLARLGSRVRRLQVVAAAEKQASYLIGKGLKKHLRMQRFELLINRT